MKKVISVAILLALLLSVISVYACDRIECRDIRSTQLPNGEIYYDCGCPAYGCKCAECKYCKDQFIEEASTPNAYLEPNYYPDYDRITPPKEAETAPKTNAGSLLPQFALAAVAVGSIAVALKRTK